MTRTTTAKDQMKRMLWVLAYVCVGLAILLLAAIVIDGFSIPVRLVP